MPSGIHAVRAIDPMLTDFTVAYQKDMTAYAAKKFFPDRPTGGVESGTYYEYDPRPTFSVTHGLRGPGGKANRIDWNYVSKTFDQDAYAYYTEVNDRVRNNALRQLDLDVDATELTNVALLNLREWRAREVLYGQDMANVDLDQSGSSTLSWNAAASSGHPNPDMDVEAGRLQIMRKTGAPPTDLRMMISPNVWYYIRTYQGAGQIIRDLIKYTVTATMQAINEKMVAAFFDVQEVFVPYAVINLGASGASAYTPGTGVPNGNFLWDLNSMSGSANEKYVGAVFLYAGPNTPGLKSRPWGVTYTARTPTTKRYRWEETESDRIETGEIAREVRVVPAAGYLINALKTPATTPGF